MSALAPLGPVTPSAPPAFNGGAEGLAAPTLAITRSAAGQSGANMGSSTDQGAGGRDSTPKSRTARTEIGEIPPPPPPPPLRERASVPTELSQKIATARAEASEAARDSEKAKADAEAKAADAAKAAEKAEDTAKAAEADAKDAAQTTEAPATAPEPQGAPAQLASALDAIAPQPAPSVDLQR